MAAAIHFINSLPGRFCGGLFGKLRAAARRAVKGQGCACQRTELTCTLPVRSRIRGYGFPILCSESGKCASHLHG